MTSCIAKGTLIACVGLLGACAQVGPTQYAKQTVTDADNNFLSTKPAYLQPAYRKLLQEGRRNQTLNYLEIGLTAFEQQDMTEARIAFDAALTDIQSIYSNNEEAAKARSAFYNEDIKDYKGEPYERSMAYFYRGLVFIHDGEFDSARAAFLNALMQDAFAEEQQNRSDFYVMLYMMGWSALMSDRQDLADESFAEIKKAIPDFVAPTKEDKVLQIVTTGQSPRKLADGVSKDQLVYRRGKQSPDGLVAIDGSKADFMGDVYWQASSRGGRPIDRLVQGQVKFKKGTRNVAGALTSVSGDLAAYSSGSGTLVGISLVGVGIQGLSNSVKVRADTRYWSNLPDRIYVFTSPQACEQCSLTLNGKEVQHAQRWQVQTDTKQLQYVDLGGIL